MKNVGKGRIGVWKIGDPNAVMTILDLTTLGNVFETGAGAVGIFSEDPRNQFTGNFFNSHDIWHEMPGQPGYYWAAHDDRFSQDVLYTHQYDDKTQSHIMRPSTIATPWAKK